MFAHLNPHSSDFWYPCALYSPCLHQLTMQSSSFEPGRPLSVVVCVARKLRPCPSYSRCRDRINLGLWRSLYKGGGGKQMTGLDGSPAPGPWSIALSQTVRPFEAEYVNSLEVCTQLVQLASLWLALLWTDPLFAPETTAHEVLIGLLLALQGLLLCGFIVVVARLLHLHVTLHLRSRSQAALQRRTHASQCGPGAPDRDADDSVSCPDSRRPRTSVGYAHPLSRKLQSTMVIGIQGGP